MVKVTFTLDEETVAAIKRIAQRLQRPQSAVIRAAIPFYEPHAGQLSAAERAQRVEVFDRLVARVPGKPAAEVDRELRSVRRSRTAGWRPAARRAPR
jgi:hypothetical protein